MIFFLAGSRVVSWVGPQWKYSSPLPHITCIICLRNVNLAVRGEALCRGDFISKTNFRLHISDYRFYLNIGSGWQVAEQQIGDQVVLSFLLGWNWTVLSFHLWLLYSTLCDFKNVDMADKFYRLFMGTMTNYSQTSRLSTNSISCC